MSIHWAPFISRLPFRPLSALLGVYLFSSSFAIKLHFFLGVFFHFIIDADTLRHSSTTYKLKLNHGDLKATQGDTGHAQIDMITSVYAHILDEDRKINAQKFESAFYANPDLRSVRPPEEPKEPAPATLDLEALVEQLRKSPELANTLAALLASAPSEK